MWRKWIIGLVLCLLFAPMLALAQTTTPTPTATITPTSTPDVNLFWTLPAATDQAGTAYPAQDVLFSYSADTGDVAISILIGVLIAELLIIFLIVLLLARKGNN